METIRVLEYHVRCAACGKIWKGIEQMPEGDVLRITHTCPESR